MNNHKNARLTVHGRAFLVKRILEEGLRPREAAQAVGVSVRTAYKWLKRYQEEGKAGLENRSSRPHHCPHATSREVLEAVIERRKARQTYHHISQALGLGLSTLARLLARHGLNRLAHLEPAPPPQRYEVETPGGLLHLDIKKLGRFRKPGPRVTQDMSFQGRSGGPVGSSSMWPSTMPRASPSVPSCRMRADAVPALRSSGPCGTTEPSAFASSGC